MFPGAFESAPAPAPVVDLSFDGDAPPGAFSPSEDWGFTSPAPTQPTIPIHQPKPTASVANIHAATKIRSTHSPPHANRVHPRSSTPSDAATSPAPDKHIATSLTKEERAAEMARRKEERKQVSCVVHH